MSGIDIHGVIREIERSVKKKINRDYIPLFKKNLLHIFQTKASPYILSKFLAQYDILIAKEKSEYGARVKDKDPLSLENYRDVFAAQISKELDEISIKGNELIIRVGDRSKWGPAGGEESSRGEPETVDFLNYYITGFIGEVGFITPDHWLDMRHKTKKGRSRGWPGFGRLGEGFLIEKALYDREKWEKRTKVKFSEIRHPISGQAPFKGFDHLSETIDVSPFVQEAVEKTFRELFK